MAIREVGKKLLKSCSWVIKVLKVFNLPKNILAEFHAVKIILSQVIVFSKYSDKTKLCKRDKAFVKIIPCYFLLL